MHLLLMEHATSICSTMLNDLGPCTKVSLALDAWSSPNHLAFLAMMAYYINTSWEYKEILLAFELLQGCHSGKNLAAVVIDVLKQFEREWRFFALTTSNASNNHTLRKKLQ